MAGKCGCAGTTCSCKIQGSGGISVTGAGTAGNPYVISGGGYFQVQDSASVHLVLLGDGTASQPFTLSAEVTLELGDIIDVDTTDTTVGKVVARHASGGFYMAPPSVAAVGSVSVGSAIEGDGSGGDPLNVKLAAQSGLEIVAGGLKSLPRTVTSEADLDTLYGAAPVGALVADTDGSGAWIKTVSGWSAILEDSGNIATTSGNITARSGFTVNSFTARRRNGVVQMRIGVTSTIVRETSLASGDIANINVADVIPANLRPVMDTPFRVLGQGNDSGFHLTSSGVFVLNNLAQPDYSHYAGYQWSLGATFIGA